MHKIWDKINQLATWQVGLIFAVVGLVVFFSGLGNPFQGDDSTQIVTNLPVHFIQNIGYFFVNSTFYDGGALVGTYYRPMMATTFSLIYTFFREWTVAYHAVQLALYIGSGFFLFLFLKHFLKKTTLALPLALIYLVHPLNSQIVFSIPCMQDALLLFFGITGVWILTRATTTRGLLLSALFLMLALFSKESGLAFVAMAFLYLGLFDRARIVDLIKIIVLPFALYLILKTQAVGLLVANANAAPIGQLDLLGRMMTAPSIVFFYIAKFFFPWTLATGWYWTEPTFTLGGVLVPIIVDIATIALFVYLGLRVRRKLSKANFRAYLFFAAWTLLGIVPYLQVTPLDMTACETWFAFSMMGVLAMVGIAIQTVKLKIRPEWIFIVLLVIIALLGIRTAVRGTDYNSQYNLAMKDLAVSKQNYGVMNNISQGLIQRKQYKEAIFYARKSIAIQPIVTNYNNLGVALQGTGDFKGAAAAYERALNYGSMAVIYENLGTIYLADWDTPKTEEFFTRALKKYPKNFKLWTYHAIMQGARGNNEEAKKSITNAAKYGKVPEQLSSAIMNHQSITFPIPTSKEPIILK